MYQFLVEKIVNAEMKLKIAEEAHKLEGDKMARILEDERERNTQLGKLHYAKCEELRELQADNRQLMSINKDLNDKLVAYETVRGRNADLIHENVMLMAEIKELKEKEHADKKHKQAEEKHLKQWINLPSDGHCHGGGGYLDVNDPNR